tara:strand:- start:782 stop:1396 length:615 start_codon:yes stop_codon:yes gene_type:complete
MGKKNFRILLTILVFLIFSSFASGKNIFEEKESDIILGNKDAPVTIIEYASLSCSHCASFHKNTLPTLIEEYVDQGKVKLIFRSFPLNYPALLGSQVIQCIPKEIQYEYLNALFLLQKQWVNKENAKTTQEIYKIMQSGGMNKENFENCISNTELENSILEGAVEAQNEFEISTTPSFLINEKLLVGNKSIKEFRQIIDKILSE